MEGQLGARHVLNASEQGLTLHLPSRPHSLEGQMLPAKYSNLAIEGLPREVPVGGMGIHPLTLQSDNKR